MGHPKLITVAELRVRMLNELNALPDDAQVFFGGGDLSLHRVKHRGPVEGPAVVGVEFNEIYSVHPDFKD
ncbi:MAG: hypothetical protein ACSLE9_00850 [Burkholderiaceae bacterium]